jgi:hypothetical protein
MLLFPKIDEAGTERVKSSVGVNRHFALWRIEEKAGVGACDEPLLLPSVEPDCDKQRGGSYSRKAIH